LKILNILSKHTIGLKKATCYIYGGDRIVDASWLYRRVVMLVANMHDGVI